MNYESFTEAYVAHLSACPNARLNLGITERLGYLPDPSTAWKNKQADSARNLLNALASVSDSDLNFEQQLDLDLARLTLDRSIFMAELTFNGRTQHAQMPTAAGDIGDGLFQLFVNDPRTAAERLDDITDRLVQVPAYLDALLHRLDTPVKRWAQIDVEGTSGLPSLFANIEAWAQEVGWSKIAELTSARQRAEVHLNRYIDELESMPTTTNFHVGLDKARNIVRLRGIELALEDIHAIAKRFLATTIAQIESLREKLIGKYQLAPQTTSDELHRWLSQKYQVEVPPDDLEAVLVRYQEERSRILNFINERGLFPVFAEQDMKLIRTPEFLAATIPAGAMMAPPAFREGVKTSLVYLTLSEELLAEHTEISIPAMMIHEGIPGHHLQLAWGARHPSKIRRMCDAMEHAEGWTTMLEDYMLDIGYAGDLTDEVRFVTKRDISRIGARVAIDLFFMSGDRDFLDLDIGTTAHQEDPFEAAGCLLQAVTGFVDARVQAELNWYSKERGYPLSYLTGNHLVWSLKKDFEESCGGPSVEADKRFHNAYLRAGNMPVSFLRRLLNERGELKESPSSLHTA